MKYTPKIEDTVKTIYGTGKITDILPDKTNTFLLYEVDIGNSIPIFVYELEILENINETKTHRRH